MYVVVVVVFYFDNLRNRIIALTDWYAADDIVRQPGRMLSHILCHNIPTQTKPNRNNIRFRVPCLQICYHLCIVIGVS